MIHKCRVLKLVDNRIVITDFGVREDNWDYQNQPLPEGIQQDQVSRTAYCDHTTLDGVNDLAQVDVQNQNNVDVVVVNLNATTLRQQRASILANAKATMANLASDGNVPNDTKTYLNALWALLEPDKFIGT